MGLIDSAKNFLQSDVVKNGVREMMIARMSERQGRVIDHDGSGSMEEKKKEGYF